MCHRSQIPRPARRITDCPLNDRIPVGEGIASSLSRKVTDAASCAALAGLGTVSMKLRLAHPAGLPGSQRSARALALAGHLFQNPGCRRCRHQLPYHLGFVPHLAAQLFQKAGGGVPGIEVKQHAHAVLVLCVRNKRTDRAPEAARPAGSVSKTVLKAS